MARDRGKNVYFTVGIPRDSALLQWLEEESGQSGTSIPKLIPVKLYELYHGTSGKRVVEEKRELPQGAEANALAFLDEEGD